MLFTNKNFKKSSFLNSTNRKANEKFFKINFDYK
jgi:hypothetical protein